MWYSGAEAAVAAVIMAAVMLLFIVLVAFFIRRAERRRAADAVEQAARRLKTLQDGRPVPDRDSFGGESLDGETPGDGWAAGAERPVAAARSAASRDNGASADPAEVSDATLTRPADISRFYAHVRTLNTEAVRIDFFEYHAATRQLLFLTGLATLLGPGSQIFREMPDADFFSEFACVSLNGRIPDAGEEHSEAVLARFREAARTSLAAGEFFRFEFRAKARSDECLVLRCWGRPDKANGKIDGAMMDITQEAVQRAADRNRFQYDNITGFFNRNALTDVGGRVLASRGEGELVVFAYFNLRRYGEFEARFGMLAGNTYIRVFADLLGQTVSDETTLFRWWGPNFLCIVRGLRQQALVVPTVSQVVDYLSKQTRAVEGIQTTFPLSVGYAVAGLDGETPAELLEYAAFAQHELDSGSGVCIRAFDRTRYDASRQVTLRRSFIREVVERNELYCVYQPIVCLKTGEVYGYEALSRPTGAMYNYIGELIEDAENTGNYAVLEKRMVYNALDGFLGRPEKYRDAWLFINTAPTPALSAADYQDIRDRYFSQMRVVYEVTERSRIDPEEMDRRKALVRETGARFALDDFGSGYSNHLALLALEPDIIKIDQGLIRDVDKDTRKQHMLGDMIAYARLGGTQVLAEGVETAAELETVCRMGVDFAQGFHLARPDVLFREISPAVADRIRQWQPVPGRAEEQTETVPDSAPSRGEPAVTGGARLRLVSGGAHKERNNA
jgi:EAL domain-containing protein (putative c-di-GMP-specific phosphodiesterase class I)/GGDEF domain-containing protein